MEFFNVWCDGESACKDTTILCITNGNCNIVCQGDDTACESTNIICKDATCNCNCYDDVSGQRCAELTGDSCTYIDGVFRP